MRWTVGGRLARKTAVRLQYSIWFGLGRQARGNPGFSEDCDRLDIRGVVPGGAWNNMFQVLLRARCLRPAIGVVFSEITTRVAPQYPGSWRSKKVFQPSTKKKGSLTQIVLVYYKISSNVLQSTQTRDCYRRLKNFTIQLYSWYLYKSFQLSLTAFIIMCIMKSRK